MISDLPLTALDKAETLINLIFKVKKCVCLARTTIKFKQDKYAARITAGYKLSQIRQKLLHEWHGPVAYIARPCRAHCETRERRLPDCIFLPSTIEKMLIQHPPLPPPPTPVVVCLWTRRLPKEIFLSVVNWPLFSAFGVLFEVYAF